MGALNILPQSLLGVYLELDPGFLGTDRRVFYRLLRNGADTHTRDDEGLFFLFLNIPYSYAARGQDDDEPAGNPTGPAS